MNLTRGSRIRSSVSSYNFKELSRPGSRGGTQDRRRSSVIMPLYECTKEELKSKNQDRENDIRSKILQKINPSLQEIRSTSNFKTLNDVNCKIDFWKILLNLVRKEKLNIRIPQSLVSGFAPNTIY